MQSITALLCLLRYGAIIHKPMRKLQYETDETLSPWERASAAAGMADYDRRNDRTVRAVTERATRSMRGEKRRRKTNMSRV